LYGGRLIVVPHHVSRDPVAFYELLEQEGVTVLNQTPSAFRQLIPVAQQLRRPLALRLVIFGGEALDLPTLRPWFDVYGDASPVLVNMYGITETTVHVTWCPLSSADTSCTASLIGRALPDLSIYVLDAQQRPVPSGVAGEIYVGGAGLARGYLNRPELTEERFTEIVVFGERRRLYRSGDLARWRADGSLEYLGRLDHQIKIRGYRVELGEIEATLSEHPGVREAVVDSVGAAPHAVLVAYVVTAGETPVADLQDWLRVRLPAYMIPARIVSVASIPLTTNGKVDRRALAALAPANDDGEVAVPPRNATERHIAAIWEEALGLEGISIADKLFSLGGHSLTAMQIVARIYEAFGVKIPVRRFFEEPTVAGLALLVGQSQRESVDAIESAPIQPDYPLSLAQQQVWLDQLMTPAAAYNVADALQFNEELDAGAVKTSFRALVDRHEILRTEFLAVEGEPRQHVHTQIDVDIREIDLRADPTYVETTRRIISEDVNAAFELSRAPLFRVTLIRQPAHRTVLVWVLHHLISDGWSLGLLYKEWSALYHACQNGLPHQLPPLPIQYKDYAMWQVRHGFERERRYWEEALAGAPRHVDLPFDRTPGPDRRFLGARRKLSLPAQTVRALRGLAAARDTTLSNVVLAVFKLFLFQITGQEDFCVTVAIANRNRAELEHVAGPFVNLVPVRTRLNEDLEIEDLLSRIERTAYEAFEHGSYPFNLLIRDLGRCDAGDIRPFLDVVYVYQNSAAVWLGIAERWPHVVPVREDDTDVAFGFAKFDLSLFVNDEGPESLWFTLEYDSGLFFEDTIANYLEELAELAACIVDAHSHGPSRDHHRSEPGPRRDS
jgi:acyl carrier protein